MTYFLDFDRTLFNTEGYYEPLLEHPSIDPLKEEIARIIATPYAVLPSDAPERMAVWKQVHDLAVSGQLSFPPGALVPYVYPDVPIFLREKGKDVVILTFGVPELQKLKVENALAGFPIRALYTNDQRKGDYMRDRIGEYGEAVFVDDQVSQLEDMQKHCPQVKCFEMRRDGKPGDGRWPVIASLSELP